MSQRHRELSGIKVIASRPLTAKPPDGNRVSASAAAGSEFTRLTVCGRDPYLARRSARNFSIFLAAQSPVGQPQRTCQPPCCYHPSENLLYRQKPLASAQLPSDPAALLPSGSRSPAGRDGTCGSRVWMGVDVGEPELMARNWASLLWRNERKASSQGL
ncbi:uncharacterized protein LOC144367185 [Ictidomys tridecemlineatus]